jgi:hypothetical protein
VNQGQSVQCFLISGSLFFPNLFIFSSSGGLFFDAPVIVLPEDLIGGLAQEIMICGAMCGCFQGIIALQMPSMIERIWP